MSKSDKEVLGENEKNTASGDSEKNQQTTESKTKDQVSYETHVKLLAEKKKQQAELEEARLKLKSFEEEKIKASGDMKALQEMYKKQAEEEKAKRLEVEATLQGSLKMSAVLEKIQGNVGSQYYGLIDLSKIAIDPQTQMPDQLSVEQYAREFEQKYAQVIERPNQNQMPNNAAKGGSQKITYEEWLKLDLKNQKLRLKDVMQS